MAKKKYKTLAIKEIEERQAFLDKYNEFDKWLRSIGFRAGHYWKESSTYQDVYYSTYDKYIDPLYSVEHFVNDTILFSVRFIRDRYKHKFMFVGGIGAHSELYSLEETKELILSEVRKLRDEKLKELKKLENI